MKIERFLELYDRINDAPDAVERMRRFVLELAVRGKLAEQNPEDEPASIVLKNKSTDVKNKVQKYSNNCLFDLPSSWQWTSIGAVFNYDAGIKRKPQDLNPSFWLLELEDIEKNSGYLVRYASAGERNPKSTKSEFQKGDVLYGKLRPYLNKVVVADRSGYSTTEIVAIRPIVPMNPDYCALALRNPDFVDYVAQLGQGTKMPRLRKPDAISAPFPLPPLAEQHRIVAKVDELMALCDQIEQVRTKRETSREKLTVSCLERLTNSKRSEKEFRGYSGFVIDNFKTLIVSIEQIKNFKKTILDLAVQGKLVKQNPDDEPVSELLKRILQNNKDVIQDTEPNGCGSNDRIIEIPSSWEWSTVENIADVLMGQSPPSEHYNKAGKGLAFFQGKSEFGERHPTPKYWCTSPKKIAERGDILVSVRAPVGPTNVADRQCCIGRGLAAIRPSGKLNSEYVLLAFKAFESDLASQGFGTTFAAITRKQLTGWRIPIPPLAEQKRIVEKANELMTICGLLELKVARTNSLRLHLRETSLRQCLL